MLKKLDVGMSEIEQVEIFNSLVDAVNELQLTVSKMENLEHLKKIGQGFKKLNDPYAEQRKWIGKLCRFRDNPACEWKYGILYRIYEDTDFPSWDTDCYEYAECEPVKPDEPIIYKGE